MGPCRHLSTLVLCDKPVSREQRREQTWTKVFAINLGMSLRESMIVLRFNFFFTDQECVGCSNKISRIRANDSK